MRPGLGAGCGAGAEFINVQLKMDGDDIFLIFKYMLVFYYFIVICVEFLEN